MMMAMRYQRRSILAGVAAVAATSMIGVAGLRWRAGRKLEYRDIPGLTPFRELVSNGPASPAVTGVENAWGSPKDLQDRVTWVRGHLCEALFSQVLIDGLTPIAYFSDVTCPSCLTLEQNLFKVLNDDGARLGMVRHELPGSAGASLDAAKAVLAATRQGGSEALRARLMQAGPVADERDVRTVAASLGLDPDLLLADMERPEIADELLTSRALAQVFGLIGTPALVINRTVVRGLVTADTIRQVIADDATSEQPPCSDA